MRDIDPPFVLCAVQPPAEFPIPPQHIENGCIIHSAVLSKLTISTLSSDNVCADLSSVRRTRPCPKAARRHRSALFRPACI